MSVYYELWLKDKNVLRKLDKKNWIGEILDSHGEEYEGGGPF